MHTQIFDAYRQRKNIDDQNSVRFVFDGQRLDRDKTPKDVSVFTPSPTFHKIDKKKKISFSSRGRVPNFFSKPPAPPPPTTPLPSPPQPPPSQQMDKEEGEVIDVFVEQIGGGC